MKGKLTSILKDKLNNKDSPTPLNSNGENIDSCSKKVINMTKNHKKHNESFINKMCSEFEKKG